ncbi:MAG: HD domain-containing phosphohydrolase [Candidatus Nitrospinota bacterium M3_3B_026]
MTKTREKVLCVDDDPNILDAYKRNLRKQFALDTALGPEEGLEAVARKGPYAVVVSDLKMPGMDGVTFLSKVAETAPDTVRVMLTGYADVNTAISSVNEGRIFRFLTKPCPPDELAKTLAASVEQYRLVMAERELLEKTLSRSVRVLIDILALVNPAAFSKATRLRRYVRHMAAELELAGAWRYELAAALSQVGCVALPTDTLEKAAVGEALTEEEERAWASHPAMAGELLKKIPRLETVAEMIENQRTPFREVSAAWQGEKIDPVALGGQLLKTAIDFDNLIMEGKPIQKAVAKLLDDPGERNPLLVTALKNIVIKKEGSVPKLLRIGELAPGMTTAEDVRTKNGILLTSKGQEINELILQRLKNFWRNGAIDGRVRVLVPMDETEGGKKEERKTVEE